MDWLVDLLRSKGIDVVLEDANDDDRDSPTYQPPGTHAFVKEGVARAGVGMRFALEALEAEYLAAGGRVCRSCPARQLEKADGRVSAVLAQRPGGGYLRAKARRAVVLATGDFSRNREMMEVFCPQYAAGFSPDPVSYDTGFAAGGLFQGDGHKMALWAGAAWQRTWPCAPMIQGSRVCTTLPYGSHRGLRLNVRGERYCNEDMNGAYTALTTLREPEGKAYIIWGSNYARETRWRAHGGRRNGPDMTEAAVYALWDDLVAKGKAVRADTLEAVVEALGLPQETALAEIARYNAHCRAGFDPDFHKAPKYLQEIREAPFYGARLDDRFFFTVLGGPRTDWRMRICDADDRPIEGLYCLGSMVGDLYAGCYNFRIPGENYGACLTFGYLLGGELGAPETVC
jgi:succinate dehydrogenase/fumarate reductase flavoprotein subunit